MADGGGVARIVKFLVVLVILYFAYTAGWPWLQEQLGRVSKSTAGTGGGGGEGGRCVEMAAAASASFGGEIPRFSRPPVDLDAWGAVVSSTQRQIADAQTECACALDSCRKASDALSELSGMVYEFDSGFRGAGGMPINAARQQERIDELLAEARDLARQGS